MFNLSSSKVRVKSSKMEKCEADAENVDGDPQSIWYIVPVRPLHSMVGAAADLSSKLSQDSFYYILLSQICTSMRISVDLMQIYETIYNGNPGLLFSYLN